MDYIISFLDLNFENQQGIDLYLKFYWTTEKMTK